MFFETPMKSSEKAFSNQLKPIYRIFWFVLGVMQTSFGQSPKEKVNLETRCLMFNGFASMVVPSGDLALDYGAYGEVGGGIQYQTKKKWIMGLEGAYMFGNGVKNDPIPNLRNPDGTVIGTNGSDAVFKVFQRATSLPAIRFGKTFSPFKNPGHNALGGITVMAGGSWFRHWTYIQDLSKKTPQFSDSYRQGYDRLSSGPTASLWIGYLYLPDHGKLNLHAEAGYTQAFTTTDRYDFAYSTPAGVKRNDGFFQIRLRICFTVKSRNENSAYYY